MDENQYPDGNQILDVNAYPNVYMNGDPYANAIINPDVYPGRTSMVVNDHIFPVYSRIRPFTEFVTFDLGIQMKMKMKL